MKKKYLAILIAMGTLFFARESFAAYVMNNHCQFGSNSTITSSTCTLGTVTSGDLIIVIDHINSSGITATTTDSSGNTYTNATFKLGGSSGRQILFYASNVVGGAGFVVSTTYSGGGTNFSSISVYEYSGVRTNSPLDTATTTNSGVVAAGQYSAGTSTTSMAGELLFAGGSGPNFTAGNGFTTVGTSTQTIEEATTTGAAGVYNAFFTTTSTSGAAIANEAFFFPAPPVGVSADVTISSGVTIGKNGGVTIR